MQQKLVNSNLQQSKSDGNNLTLLTNNILNYKLASGDNMGIEIDASYERGHNNSTSEQQLRYQLTPTLNSILNRQIGRASCRERVSVGV